jgi:hypothetical protein
LLLLAIAAASTLPAMRGGARCESVGREFIPPEHWSYPALDRFEALGLVDLPAWGLHTRTDAVRYTEEIRAEAARRGLVLAGRDRFELDRLEEEFGSETALANPRERYDRPLLYLEEDRLRLEGDVDLAASPEKPPFDDEWRLWGVTNLSAKLHLGSWITYDVRYRVTATQARDEWAHKSKPSPREKSWHGIASLYERAYLVFEWKPILLYWGRDYEDWGPNDMGNLIVSKTAESFDKVGGRLSIGRVRLSFFHSYLTVEETRRTFSAHRLEFDVRDFTFGIAETALYIGRGIDPIYLLPFSSFYANQFNERGDDNILWSLDAKYRLGRRATLFGSLLVDDFQFERDGTNPDKLGFDAGARVAVGGRVPATIEMKYRYVDIYTYSHRDTLKNYLAGRGDLSGGDLPLGAVEGPDTDRLDVEADCFVRPDLTLTALFGVRRRGEGNDFRKFEEGMDPYVPFPSGVVERTTVYGLGLRWEIHGGSRLEVGVEQSAVDNRDHVSGANDESTAFRASFLWDL